MARGTENEISIIVTQILRKEIDEWKNSVHEIRKFSSIKKSRARYLLFSTRLSFWRKVFNQNFILLYSIIRAR